VHELIERQVQHLVRLIDDLLDVSRISRGKLHLRKERVQLAGVLERALEVARPLIERAGHALEVSLPPQPIPSRRIQSAWPRSFQTFSTTPASSLSAAVAFA